MGLVIGREKIEDMAVSKAAMETGAGVRARIIAELNADFGFKDPLADTLCRSVQTHVYGRSFQLARKEEMDAFLAAGGHGDQGCPKVCGVAAKVAAEEILKLR